MDEECPILDLFLLSNDQTQYYKKLGFKILSHGDKTIAYSKKVARNGINLEPIIDTAVTVGEQLPCYGPDRNKFVLTDSER